VNRQLAVILTLAVAGACVSLVAHAAKTSRSAQTVQFDRNTSVTGFQPLPKGHPVEPGNDPPGWFLIQSYNNEATGKISHTVIEPTKLCALPADDPGSDTLFVSHFRKPGKAAKNKALGSMAWSWKMDAHSIETGYSDTINAVIYVRQDGELKCMHMHNSNYAERKKTKLFKN
jgi:hypothetical protein